MAEAGYRKKLIEVALPLEDINREAAREKSIRHGHPSTLHLWWARRPLAACRAVLFSQLVDDPEQDGLFPEFLAEVDRLPSPSASEVAAAAGSIRRARLFGLIKRMVKWENSNDEEILGQARRVIRASCGGDPPPVYDPFCGGGSIPLEAQRLGLKCYASDLNPVAVLITKALVEFPPRFAGRPPVNPEARSRLSQASKWKRAAGLAEDVRSYGKWMRDEAEKRIGHLYPKVQITAEMAADRPDLRHYVGKELTVIAWLWARTVKCPNPACGAQMPMVRSFELSKKAGRRAWIEPIVDPGAKSVRFEVRDGDGDVAAGTKQARRSRCLLCGQDGVSDAVLRDQATQWGIGALALATVAEGRTGRVYLTATEPPPVPDQVPQAPWLQQDMPDNARWFSPPMYGLTTYRDLFTDRQLVALTTFSDLVQEAREKALEDTRAAAADGTWGPPAGPPVNGHSGDGPRLADGGDGPDAYADAVATYLGFGVDRGSDYWSTICSWNISRDNVRNTFARQAIPMVWDFVEVNPFSDSSGNWDGQVDWIWRVIGHVPALSGGTAEQGDASLTDGSSIAGTIGATDPPYYDNVGYSDLSDFFYVWLRRSLGDVHPSLFSTLLTPKSSELVATPYRFGGDRNKAERFFEQGLLDAFVGIHRRQDDQYPATVFYAFKQAGQRDDSGPGAVSTGWETMLSGLLDSGLGVVGTWPMRTERSARTVALGTNALASSIMLVCRARLETSSLGTRAEFLSALRAELPDRLRVLQSGNIAPVDLAQASIGPGMEVFSRYSKVLESDGKAMTVGAALGLINQVLEEVLAEYEGEYDPDTRWAVAWFEQFGMRDGEFGQAEVLSKAKNTAIDVLARAGIVHRGTGKVRLLGRDEISDDWDPAGSGRLSIWETTQRLVRAHFDEGSEDAAGEIVAQLGGEISDRARDLAYRLYDICNRKGRAEEGVAYNALVTAWPSILSAAERARGPVQAQFPE